MGITEIMRDLHEIGHAAAINLINILAFLEEEVPVGLISMARNTLQMRSVRVTTSTIPGDHRGIDVTTGALICHGLVERTTDQYGNKKKQSDTEIELTTTVDAIERIRLHAMVQDFCRSELKSMDNTAVLGDESMGMYDW